MALIERWSHEEVLLRCISWVVNISNRVLPTLVGSGCQHSNYFNQHSPSPTNQYFLNSSLMEKWPPLRISWQNPEVRFQRIMIQYLFTFDIVQLLLLFLFFFTPICGESCNNGTL